MIYEFLYSSKPIETITIIIASIGTFIFFGFFLFFYWYPRRPLKEKYRTSTTYRYDPKLRKHIAVSKNITECIVDDYTKRYCSQWMIPTGILCVIFLMILAISVYDHVTTPNENIKTTDLYRITKEKDYLTFTAKKPYNHLYKTKTMKITYTNSSEYVIVTDNQTYKISKTSIKEK